MRGSHNKRIHYERITLVDLLCSSSLHQLRFTTLVLLNGCPLRCVDDVYSAPGEPWSDAITHTFERIAGTLKKGSASVSYKVCVVGAPPGACETHLDEDARQSLVIVYNLVDALRPMSVEMLEYKHYNSWIESLYDFVDQQQQ